MRSLLCAREFAIQCSLRDRKGAQLSQLFFLIYGECMRKTAEQPRKRGPIRPPLSKPKVTVMINTSGSRNGNAKFMN